MTHLHRSFHFQVIPTCALHVIWLGYKNGCYMYVFLIDSAFCKIRQVNSKNTCSWNFKTRVNIRKVTGLNKKVWFPSLMLPQAQIREE